MASLTLREKGRVLTDSSEIGEFLDGFGVWYRRHEGQEPLSQDAGQEQVLAAYREPIQSLMAEGGYRTADVVNITPDTPDEMLSRFDREHFHAEDEVRFIVGGRGLFHIHPEGGQVFCIEMAAGDMIRLPKGTLHWFHVCAARRCRAVRLFQDESGWTPHYTGSGIEDRYPPIWSPAEVG
jgi:1,2-dihydroxy-3-keto-5-methylthiopentene dioxygenase